MFKKIYRGFNLMGNRIKNVKVDTPTHEENPVTKKYADDQVTYDTESSSKQSTKFPWLNNVEGDNVKEVFDKLIYPLVLPEFFETDIKNLIIESNETYLTTLGNSLNVFGDNLNLFTFKFEVNLNDRALNNLPKVRITKKDNSTIIGDTNVFASKPQVSLNFIPDEVLKIEVVLPVLAVTTPKQDSNGNDYIDPNFTTNKDVLIDITENFNSILNRFLSTRIVTFEDDVDVDDYFDTVPDSSGFEFNPIYYVKVKRNIQINKQPNPQGLRQQKLIIFLDKKLCDNFDINFLGYNGMIEDLSVNSKYDIQPLNEPLNEDNLFNCYLITANTVLNILPIKFS